MNTQESPAVNAVQHPILPCKFCGDLPTWAELASDHFWRNKKYASWDGWLTHECKAKYYALAGAKRYVYEDWNIQQDS